MYSARTSLVQLYLNVADLQENSASATSADERLIVSDRLSSTARSLDLLYADVLPSTLAGMACERLSRVPAYYPPTV